MDITVPNRVSGTLFTVAHTLWSAPCLLRRRPQGILQRRGGLAQPPRGPPGTNRRRRLWSALRQASAAPVQVP